MEWISLTDSSQLTTIKEESETSTVAIFKHSTSCGISRMVLKGFEKEGSQSNLDNIKFYFLDLLQYRSVSNEIAETFDVQHESPQLIIIKNGVVKHHSSHSSISFSSFSL